MKSSGYDGVKFSKNNLLAYIVFGCLFIAFAVSYYQTFRQDRTLEDIFYTINEKGYAPFGTYRVKLTLENDSILYESLFRDGIDWQMIRNNYIYMPNIIGISILAHFEQWLGPGVVFFNILSVLVTGALVILISARLRTSALLPLACLFLNPATVFYCQSATKEIPLILCCAVLAYLLAFCTVRNLILFAVPVVLFTGIIRAQTGAIMAWAVLLGSLSYKHSLRLLWVGFIVAFAFLPVLASTTGYWDAADQYRDTSGRIGIGEVIDNALKYVPFSGFVCIPLRAGQNALDPFPFAPVFVGDTHTWNVYIILYQFCFYYISFVFLGIAPIILKFLTGGVELPCRTKRLVLFLLLAWLSVAIVPYVQGRYLFPFAPFAALCMQICGKYVTRTVRRVTLLMWGSVASLQTLIFLSAVLN